MIPQGLMERCLWVQVLCLWTCEPDHVQHFSGLGTDNTETAEILRRADAQFGGFIDWLAATGRDKHTNVLAMSDHGHFTIREPPQGKYTHPSQYDVKGRF